MAQKLWEKSVQVNKDIERFTVDVIVRWILSG